MSRIALRPTAIVNLATYQFSSPEIEVDMTEDQMFDVISQIQNRVGYRTWDGWVNRLDPDAPPRTEAFASDGSALA